MSGILDKLYIWSKNSIVDELLVFAVLIALIETYAQNNLKGDTLLVGIVVYSMVGYILHYAYHKFPLSKINVTWSSISIILAAGLGYVLYEEPLDKWKIFSVISGLFAIYFASLSK